LESLVACGTRVWLDSVDPELVRQARADGATGATSNPIIIADLIQSGRYGELLQELLQQGLTDEAIAWRLADELVSEAEQVFRPVWEQTAGDDGYVSFEIDPLLEDPSSAMSHGERVARYVAMGRQWSAGHPNRLIKVPATPAGLEALEELAAWGVPLNVTLLFTPRQYRAAREAVWRGAQRLRSLDRFKSVYSIFVSRLDVYTRQQVPQLSAAAQGQVGILNAKRIWAENAAFWRQHPTPLSQQIVFASTGTKHPSDPPWKYVQALAGGDVQTNPPATNQAAKASGLAFDRQLERLPEPEVQAEIDRLVDMQRLESTLMREGVEKFVRPQKELLHLIAQQRRLLLARA
jgi:transaldolase